MQTNSIDAYIWNIWLSLTWVVLHRK